MTFIKSNQIGRSGENLVVQLLNKAGVAARLNISKDIEYLKRHDIECRLEGVKFTVETKFDRMQADTRNLAIEFHNPRSGRASGLLATTSDIWAVVLRAPAAVWVCRTSRLQSYFENEKPIRDVSFGGDGNASLRLFDSDEILSAIFHRIDNLPPCEVVAVLKHLLSEKFTHAHLADSVQDVVSRTGAGMANHDAAC